MSDQKKQHIEQKPGSGRELPQEKNTGGGSGPKSDGNKQAGKPGGKKPGFSFYWIYAILAVIFIGLQFFNWGGSAVEISQMRFDNEMLVWSEEDGNDIEKIKIINQETVEVFIKEDRLYKSKYEDAATGRGIGDVPRPHYVFRIASVENFDRHVREVQESWPREDRFPIYPETRKSWGTDILSWLLPIGLLIAFWIFIMRRMSAGGGPGGQIFNIGKSKATLFDKDTHVNIDFKDVAGLEEAKIELMEIVDFLKNPKKYTELGGKIPKGALLVGPPGTGKTLLAKAVAGQAQVPFFSLSGSDFVEMFVGVGASRVRDLFKTAKEKAPCIIFIDEIDAIGRARGKNPVTGSNDERENTLNQLLTEMDGFGTNVGVIILAATNRADILDRALLRAGRFDRQIHVEMPDLTERESIFSVHMKPLKLSKEVETGFLAKQTPGFSGADIANVCNEAALIAARRNKKEVGKQDFMDAIDRIIGGLEKRNKIISPTEKKVIAYHESGHAAVSWMLEHAHPLVKVTIVPRGKALGAAWYLPEERQISTYDQMLDEITSTLGGRAAEEIIFGKISTGALNDLEKITKQAYAMVAYFGLNKKIGNISYYDSSGQNEYSFTKPYSDKTAQQIDEEVRKLVEEAYVKAKKILLENKENLIRLGELLLEKEVIFREDLEAIFGERPFPEAEHSKEKEFKIGGTPDISVKAGTDGAEGSSPDTQTT
ncbi:MAG: ATP-dependent zinc metalloprotease FtsH [Bacteroidales bacterium]|nr:ATP-dependent zinc metalloprotease FtsH [Bacteroidales bacterium]